jgi:transcriptional regulator with XRE-family HTH domain
MTTMIEDKEEWLVALGRRLRSLRKGRGLSQRQLALGTGLDGSKMAKIEQGKINVTFTTLLVICERLEISLAVFFDEDEFRKSR